MENHAQMHQHKLKVNYIPKSERDIFGTYFRIIIHLYKESSNFHKLETN